MVVAYLHCVSMARRLCFSGEAWKSGMEQLELKSVTFVGFEVAVKGHESEFSADGKGRQIGVHPGLEEAVSRAASRCQRVTVPGGSSISAI
ncbi:MAG: hypothetical protein NZM04_06245 [Methylacidiphilales bacterium]|nr:hypothetical protein [Candidatus Methylacidiphilales bacterium]